MAVRRPPARPSCALPWAPIAVRETKSAQVAAQIAPAETQIALSSAQVVLVQTRMALVGLIRHFSSLSVGTSELSDGWDRRELLSAADHAS